MNFVALSYLLVVLAILFSCYVSVQCYIRHWSQRNSKANINEYEVRFIGSKAIKIPNKISKATFAMFLKNFVTFLVTVIIGSHMYSNFDRFKPIIDLDDNELSQIKYQDYNWEYEVDEFLPTISSLRKDIGKKKIVLLQNKTHGEGIFAMGIWKKYLSQNRIKYSHCYWQKLSKCKLNNSIIVVLPGYWSKSKTRKLLAQGHSLLFTGAPSQLLKSKDRTFHFFGLKFEKSRIDETHLALRGDQILTLGFDAGFSIPLNRIQKGYRVTATNPQAVGFKPDELTKSTLSTRLYAYRYNKEKQGRLVWMDFAPNIDSHPKDLDAEHLDSLNASVFRFLLKKSYSSIATWPQAKEFAGFMAQDTEDGYEHTKSVVELFKRRKYPVSWFAISDLALINRNLTKEMLELGDVNCHGDNHENMPEFTNLQQVTKIARCSKVIKELTGTLPKGYRAPREKANNGTLNAVFKNNMAYYFIGMGVNRTVPFIKKNSKGKITLLPRSNSDDYELWQTQSLNKEESLQVINFEMETLKHLGGLYTFSFHSQYMDEAENLSILDYIGEQLVHQKAYFATAAEISDWWQVRQKLTYGESVSKDLLYQFAPVRLIVTKSGKLIKKPLLENNIHFAKSSPSKKISKNL